MHSCIVPRIPFLAASKNTSDVNVGCFETCSSSCGCFGITIVEVGGDVLDRFQDNIAANNGFVYVCVLQCMHQVT